jgi:hypothetical protein
VIEHLPYVMPYFGCKKKMSSWSLHSRGRDWCKRGKLKCVVCQILINEKKTQCREEITGYFEIGKKGRVEILNNINKEDWIKTLLKRVGRNHFLKKVIRMITLTKENKCNHADSSVPDVVKEPYTSWCSWSR